MAHFRNEVYECIGLNITDVSSLFCISHSSHRTILTLTTQYTHVHYPTPPVHYTPLLSGVAMAIADASHVIDEVWFVAEGSVVKILNFAGTIKGE